MLRGLARPPFGDPGLDAGTQVRFGPRVRGSLTFCHSRQAKPLRARRLAAGRLRGAIDLVVTLTS